MQKSHISVFSGLFAVFAASSLAAFGADPSPRSLSSGESDIAICGFENFNAGSPPSSGWSNAGDTVVAEYAQGEGYAGEAPKPFTDVGGKYLSVDSGDEVTLSAPSSASVTYVDTVVQIPATFADPDETSFDDAKFALWFATDENGTNLCVRGAKFTSATKTEPATYKFALGNVETGSWHRVTVGAYASIAADGAQFAIPAFDVRFDGNYLFTEEAPCAAGVNVTVAGDYDMDFRDGVFIPAIGCNGTAGTLSSVGFTGTGAVDDVVVTTIDPTLPVTMLTWDPSLESVSYTINDEPGDQLTASAGSYICQIPSGATIVMTGNNGYRSFSTTGTKLETPTGLAYYTAGDGTAGNPYEIPTFEALVAMTNAVAGGAGNYRSAYYIQTADIDGTGKGAFAGIGVYHATPTNGTPFTGTYDGQGYKIKNIDFTQRNYGGVFNQVNGGTIKNLTVSNITCSAFSSGEFGFAIVGNAGNGATLTNLVAEGVFASENQPATHNVAGIVIRASAGGNGTLVKDCTNNATLYGNYTKIGGICAITQEKVTGGAVTFDGCANNGAIHRVGEAITTTATTPVENSANGGFGGIVAYTADATVVVNCSNSGTISVPAGSTVARVGEIVGWGSSKTLVDQGGNSGDAAKKLLGSTGATITGFKYATVDNGVATTIAPPYTLAKDTTYLLEGNATPSFELAAEGDAISFDTALGYTLTDTGISAANGLEVSPSTSGTVTTYTAVVPVYVAKIGVTSYKTLAAAVAAAQNGDTVELLDNVTLDTRVEPNVGSGTALTIDLGGYTITRTGTSGNGSAFDVKSGNVVITNGVIDCTQDDTAIAADGVYAITSRSGSNVTLADLTVTVDSECGACAYPFAGSTLTIESGTYANVTTTPYRYHPAWTGMAVNQANVSDRLITINGGTFSQVDPQIGDDSTTGTAAASADFTSDGFVAIDDGNGNFVVQEGYNVTFDADGGTPAPDAQRVAAGGKAAEPATAPEKSGFTFGGWTLGGSAYDFDTVLSGDIELVAAWTEDAPPQTEPDPVDPGSSMTPAQIEAYPPVQVDGTNFKVHFVGQEGVSYQLVAADSCNLTKKQWESAPGVGDAKTTADANADGVIELSAPTGGAAAKFYKIKAFTAE